MNAIEKSVTFRPSDCRIIRYSCGFLHAATNAISKRWNAALNRLNG